MTKATALAPGVLLPPAELERVCKAMAMLEAILSPDFEFRYYSYNCHWDDALSQRVASMQNGSGDEYFILFQPSGVILKGYEQAHRLGTREAVTDLFAAVPSHYSDFLNEPAFELENSTFCYWHDGQWEKAEGVAEPDKNGSTSLLGILTGRPEDYQAYAEGYYLSEVPIESVRKIFSITPLTQELVASLNPDVSIEQLASDIAEIGYPLKQG